MTKQNIQNPPQKYIYIFIYFSLELRRLILLTFQLYYVAVYEDVLFAKLTVVLNISWAFFIFIFFIYWSRSLHAYYFHTHTHKNPNK